MRRFGLLVILCSLFVGVLAEAYVLPAPFLLRMLADKRRDQKLRDISARLSTQSLIPNPATGRQ